MSTKMQDESFNDTDDDSTGLRTTGLIFINNYDVHEPWEEDCGRHPLEVAATKRRLQADMQQRVAASVLEQYMQAREDGIETGDRSKFRQ